MKQMNFHNLLRQQPTPGEDRESAVFIKSQGNRAGEVTLWLFLFYKSAKITSTD